MEITLPKGLFLLTIAFIFRHPSESIHGCHNFHFNPVEGSAELALIRGSSLSAPKAVQGHIVANTLTCQTTCKLCLRCHIILVGKSGRVLRHVFRSEDSIKPFKAPFPSQKSIANSEFIGPWLHASLINGH